MPVVKPSWLVFHGVLHIVFGGYTYSRSPWCVPRHIIRRKPLSTDFTDACYETCKSRPWGTLNVGTASAALVPALQYRIYAPGRDVPPARLISTWPGVYPRPQSAHLVAALQPLEAG
jgi:hypothetical protein